FFMMFAKVSGRVKKLSGKDRRLQRDLVGRVEKSFTARSGGMFVVVQGVIQSLVSGFQTGITAFEQGAHVTGNQRRGEALVSIFALHIAQVERARGVKVGDSPVVGNGSNRGLSCRVFESNEFHRIWPCVWTLKVY